MKRAPLWIAIAVTCAAAVGAGVAATTRLNSVTQVPTDQPTPTLKASPAQPYKPSDLSSQVPDTPQPKLDDFPHQRITLQDDTASDPDFAQFRQQLGQAIKKRDAEFVASLIPAQGIALGFGRPQTLKDLNLEDPEASFWNLLDKALGSTCGTASVEAVGKMDGWVCPTVYREFYRQYPPKQNTQGIEYEISHVVVVGDRVNVRAQPSLNSSVIAVLSNELVKFDSRAFENSKEEQIEAHNPIDGWTPVTLPNRKKGYVYNRYAYHPLEYRVIFTKAQGQWQIVQVPGGD